MGFADLHRRLFAAWYDRAMRGVERNGLGDWRRELLAGLSGTVLEIGAGTGLNLPCYPQTIKRLVLSEPDPYMREKLQAKPAVGRTGIEVISSGAEQLEMTDASCDAVVSTLVLCSVNHPQTALEEIRRVLKPGGSFLFIEHVRSDHHGIRFWQNAWEPLWKRACGNCHLTRQTAELIRTTGFEIEEMEDLRMEGAPAIVRRTMVGKAKRCDV